MKVLVYEPATGGHHLVFLRYIVEDLLAAGHRVALAVEYGSAPSARLSGALGLLAGRCEWVPLRNGAGRWLHGWKLDAVVHAQAKARADVVFLCCFDELSSALFRRTALGVPPPASLAGRVTGIFVRPRVADTRAGKPAGLKFRGFQKLAASRWFTRLFTLDETLPSALRPGLQSNRFPVLPDPWSGDFGIGRAQAREKLGLPADAFLFLHYGTSSRRKGFGTLLKAVEALPPDGRGALVAAGRVSERESPDQALLQPLVDSGRVKLFNRYIEDSEEPLFFRACDAVILAYEGHYGSSNVQSRAAAAGRPVISSDEGLVGWRTQQHQLGLTFPAGDATALAAAILRARDASPSLIAPGLADYAVLHSRESFRTALIEGLQSIGP